MYPAMMAELDDLQDRIAGCTLCRDRFAATVTAHRPRPVAWLSNVAPVLICGQAPGERVHASGVPFDDPSGERLRGWLGVDRARFYDRTRFAMLPMAFCFPGQDRRGADLPPPRVCARTWRLLALAVMPQVKLTLLVGGAALAWHLGARSVTKAVADWRAAPAGMVPLPHPSWRNNGWLRRHPWFEADLVPELRARIAALGLAA